MPDKRIVRTRKVKNGSLRLAVERLDALQSMLGDLGRMLALVSHAGVEERRKFLNFQCGEVRRAFVANEPGPDHWVRARVALIGLSDVVSTAARSPELLGLDDVTHQGLQQLKLVGLNLEVLLVSLDWTIPPYPSLAKLGLTSTVDQAGQTDLSANLLLLAGLGGTTCPGGASPLTPPPSETESEDEAKSEDLGCQEDA